MTDDQIKKFWGKVDIKGKIDCWEWTGAKKPKGYGNVRIDKKYLSSHRIAWELSNGDIPSGLVVMHICDNPSCCNPSHLVLGTMKSNSFDMIKKRRDGFKKNKAKGENNGNSKLKNSDIDTIRSIYKERDISQSDIGDMFGVSQTTISRVLLGRTWRGSNA